MSKSLKWLYVLLLCLVFIFVEVKYLQTQSHEVGFFLVWVMIALTFPLGIIVPLILSAIGVFCPFDRLFGEGNVGTGLFLFFVWLGMGTIGFWQWFILLPKLVKKFNRIIK